MDIDVDFDRESGPWPCALPNGCLFNDGTNYEHIKIRSEDLSEAIRVCCSSENCPVSPFMHASCFEAFEESALQALRTSSRSKSWTDKQRLQNLWTKRGLDLAANACQCLCGEGTMKKDLEWISPTDHSVEEDGAGQLVGSPDFANSSFGSGSYQETGSCAGIGRRRRKKSKSQSSGKATITIGLPVLGTNAAAASSSVNRSEAQNVPQPSASSTQANSVQNVFRNRTNSFSSNASGGSYMSSPAGSPPGVTGFSSTPQLCHHANPSSSTAMGLGASPGMSDDFVNPARRSLLQDRIRHDSGGSIFQRRPDYSSFNVLPKHKINSYHIKMEDECSIGNDETRIFILSSFASNKMNRVPCVICNQIMTIYDRYPLVDGTFFLSPRQHNKSCIQVKVEGKVFYLSSVCMACLESWTTSIHCRYCLKAWTGAHLILGTMYSYDIFAAMPCCAERLKCNNCSQLVIHPDQRFNFFSDYSQMVSCPHCGVQDYHFCKNLNIYISREDAQKVIMQQQQAQGVPGMRIHRVNSA